MHVDVIGRHISLGKDQTAHATAEAEKLAKFFDGINGVRITIEREHDDLKTEIVCSVSGGKTLVAVEKGRTIHESLECASDNMARQIKKHKARLHDRRTRGAAREEEEEELAPEKGELEEEE